MSVPSRSKRNDGAEVEVFTGWVDDSSRSEHPRMATGFFARAGGEYRLLHLPALHLAVTIAIEVKYQRTTLASLLKEELLCSVFDLDHDECSRRAAHLKDTVD